MFSAIEAAVPTPNPTKVATVASRPNPANPTSWLANPSR